MVTAEQNEKKLKRGVVVATALLLLSVAALLALVAFIVVPSGGVLAATVIVTLYLWFFIWTLRKHAGRRSRVVPYFELKYFRSGDPSRKTAEESRNAFRAGNGIAVDLRRLDELSCQLGVAPLSSFGFGDDLLKQHPQWSDLSDGLQTLAALLANVSEPEVARSFDAKTVTDLQTLAVALEKARESQNKFCLILRHGADDEISGVEMEKRQGSFWF